MIQESAWSETLKGNSFSFFTCMMMKGFLCNLKQTTFPLGAHFHIVLSHLIESELLSTYPKYFWNNNIRDFKYLIGRPLPITISSSSSSSSFFFFFTNFSCFSWHFRFHRGISYIPIFSLNRSYLSRLDSRVSFIFIRLVGSMRSQEYAFASI